MIHFTSTDEDLRKYLEQSYAFAAVCKGTETGRIVIIVDGVVFYVFREARVLCLAFAFQETSFDYNNVIEPFMRRFAILMKSMSGLGVSGV